VTAREAPRRAAPAVVAGLGALASDAGTSPAAVGQPSRWFLADVVDELELLAVGACIEKHRPARLGEVEAPAVMAAWLKPASDDRRSAGWRRGHPKTAPTSG
jgi:hypothetical protein